jgi:hypothetical protein
MTHFSLDAAVAPGIANVTMGMVLSGQEIKVMCNFLAPAQRGDAIAEQTNLRDASTMALEGPAIFGPPRPTKAAYIERLERLICWHPSSKTRAAACQVVGMEDVADLADSLLTLGSSDPKFVDACLSLDLEQAKEMFAAREVGNIDLASYVLEEMRIVRDAFEVQRTAALAWRLIHIPFDNHLDEANKKESGYATISGALGHLNGRRADISTVMRLYDTGRNDIKDAEIPFLEKYGLGALRKRKVERRLLKFIGDSKVGAIRQQLERQRDMDALRQAALSNLKDVQGKPIPFAAKPKRRLASYLYEGSLPCDLAMVCATLAERLDGNPIPIDQAPSWLFQVEDASDGDFVSGRKRFLQVYLFYRRVFVPDDLQADVVSSVDEFINEDRAVSSGIKLDHERVCRLVLKDMKKKALDGSFGCRSTLMSEACRAGYQSYWDTI